MSDGGNVATTGHVGADAQPPVVSAPPGTPTLPPHQLVWIDVLKVLAIIGVVSIHVCGATAAAPWAHDSRLGWLAIALDLGFIFAVPVFVMASGALLLEPSRYQGTAQFLRRRALRILPALVVWHIVYAVFRAAYLGRDDSLKDLLVLTLTGRLYPHLYFFWIILGLALVTPVLIPWIAQTSRRGILVAGVCAAAMPVLTVSMQTALHRSPVWVETPWTWWIFYLGLFILGSALRHVHLPPPVVVGAAVATVLLGALLIWQWHNPAAPTWLQIVSPVSYYGLGVHLYAVLVFLVVAATVRPGGALGILTGTLAARMWRRLGGATLGVFAMHFVFVSLVPALPVIGGDATAASAWQLLARIAFVVVVSFAVTLPLKRVPFVRAVL